MWPLGNFSCNVCAWCHVTGTGAHCCCSGLGIETILDSMFPMCELLPTCFIISPGTFSVIKPLKEFSTQFPSLRGWIMPALMDWLLKEWSRHKPRGLKSTHAIGYDLSLLSDIYWCLCDWVLITRWPMCFVVYRGKHCCKWVSEDRVTLTSGMTSCELHMAMHVKAYWAYGWTENRWGVGGAVACVQPKQEKLSSSQVTWIYMTQYCK